MKSADGDLVITFNGELYNYRELRTELENAGSHFRSSSDTEVILLAYAVWGESCVTRFRGMFAFVIWDGRSRKLFAARDPFGEKPLYLSFLGDGTIVFASEIKALLASGLIRPQVNQQAIDAYLALAYVPPETSAFNGIVPLQPGHTLRADADEVVTSRYWTPLVASASISLDDAADQLRELLRAAVKRQMVADVPIGAFLSGGLDSSTIVALMREQSSDEVQTFSVAFGKYINELPYARSVAETYGTRHHEVDLGEPPVLDMLERMATVYDEPFADSSNIPTYMLSEFARKHVKVVLSGDGADELFGGYAWYRQILDGDRGRSSIFHWVALKLAAAATRNRSVRIQIAAEQLRRGKGENIPTGALISHTNTTPQYRQMLWGLSDPPRYHIPSSYQLKGSRSHLERALFFDLNCYLPGDILVKVDRAAMAHGLETRAPFLDLDLAEFAIGLPDRLKVDREQSKIVLRAACQQYWPEELRNRGKQGFGAPWARWLENEPVRKRAAELFGEGSRLRALLPGLPRRLPIRRSYSTWQLIALGLWLEAHEVDVST